MLLQKTSLSLAAVGLVMVIGADQATAQQTITPAPQTVTPAPQIQPFVQPQNADFLRTSQVLGIPTSNCGHVISLMMQNRFRQQLGTNGGEDLHLPHLTVGLKPGDLELVGVNLICDATAHAGPVFQIGMRNNSAVPIGNFHVSIVGILGQIHVHSPTTTICVKRMEAGETRLLQMQLPLTCLSMGFHGQQAEFDTLIVAADAYDDLLECNELNNVQILKRCDVALLAPETPAVTAPAAPDVSPYTTPPIPPVEGAPHTKKDSPQDELDSLDLEDLGLESSLSLSVKR